MLRPVMALVLWTFVMWLWMYATRIPAIRRSRMKLDRIAPRGEQMATLPPEVRWKADNYNHLFEMPTLFYAVCIVQVMQLGAGVAPLDVGLAWGFVGLRVVHSLVQSLVNVIELRFALFVFSSVALLVLSIRTTLLVW